MTKNKSDVWTRTWRFLCSLKLAVFVLLSLAMALATATVIESLYDTATAQYFVYRSLWFRSILGLLALQLFCVMVDRYPWKPRHVPFLLAHIGILILLFGSWLTDKFGLDGMLRITEGESSSVVELDQPMLVLTESQAPGDTGLPKMQSIPIIWQPPGVDFKKFNVSSKGAPFDLVVDGFMSHADVTYSFIPNDTRPEGKETSKDAPPRLPAAKLKIVGGPMRVSQEIWLWAGDASTRGIQAGPAYFSLFVDGVPLPVAPMAAGGPRFNLRPEKDGSVSFEAISSSGEKVRGRFTKDKFTNQVIDPKWRGGVSITLQEWIPDAIVRTDYKPARVQYGNMAPASAIHLSTGKGGTDSDLWLGIGSRAVLRLADREVEVGYYNRRVILPFSVRLDRFTVDRYEGTMRPSSYSSNVTVTDGHFHGEGTKSDSSHLISMNEPLEHKGVTLYQASYEDAMPRPTTSILSVNRDPGRVWKYVGSLLLVFGSVLLFAMKYRRKKQSEKAGQQSSTVSLTSASEGVSL